MHFRSLTILALTSIALGQAVPVAAPGTPASMPKKATGAGPGAPVPLPLGGRVGANDPVITVQGICDTPAARKAGKPASNSTGPSHKASDCKTVITRAQFELLAAALQPDMSPAMKRRLAELYPTMIIMSHTAQERGYQNTPQFKELMEFSRIQALSTQLNRAVEKESREVSPADLDKYYRDNPAAFEEVTVERIFVPKSRVKQQTNDQANSGAPAEAQKTDEDTMKKEADALETRAAAGEEFDKLQKEAFELAGLAPPASSTNVKIAVRELSASQRALLDMKPGEVSPVFSESNGYFIYKFLSKGQKPLDDKAREDLKAKLSQQRFQQTMDELHKSFTAILNERYFTPEAAQARPNRPVQVPRPVPPGGGVPAARPAAGTPPTSSGAPVASPAPKVEVPESGSAKPGAPQPAEPPQ